MVRFVDSPEDLRVEEPTMRKLTDKIRVLENKNRKFNDLLEKIKEDFREVERLRDARYAALKEATHAVCQENLNTWYGSQPSVIALREALLEVDRLEPTSQTHDRT